MMEDVSKSVTLRGDAPRSFPYPMRLGQVQTPPRLVSALFAIAAPAERTTAKRTPAETTTELAATGDAAQSPQRPPHQAALPVWEGGARARSWAPTPDASARDGRVAFNSVCPLRVLRLLVAAIMPLEATLMIIDNSEYMRNGDYQPSRFDAQQDAVNTIFQTKIDSNPENTVGVMTMAGKGCVTVLPPQLRPRMTSLACVAQRSS